MSDDCPDDLAERTRERMRRHGIPRGSDDPIAQALGAPPLGPDNFTKAQAVAAEGARIGFVTCERCGAAVMLDMQIDAPSLHARWHQDPRG